jgi:HSP20 family molecular chaperone IbpA
MTELVPETMKRSISRLRDNIHAGLDRWFRRRTRFENGKLSMLVNAPQIDVEDNGNEVVVVAEIPGFSDKDVCVEITDNRLVLRGGRSLAAC